MSPGDIVFPRNLGSVGRYTNGGQALRGEACPGDFGYTVILQDLRDDEGTCRGLELTMRTTTLGMRTSRF